MRRAARRDVSEHEIADALTRAGAVVIRMNEPVDLLVLFRDRWHLLECKSPGANLKRKDRAKQQAFCRLHHVPVVQTAEQALLAIGALHQQAVDFDVTVRLG